MTAADSSDKGDDMRQEIAWRKMEDGTIDVVFDT
jgi:hypothetical protein